MRYMMFIKHTEDYLGKTPPMGLMEAMGKFIGGHAAKGTLIDGAGLKSTHAARKVRLRDGRMDVIDGPFTESKEIVGGYALMELPSDEEAMAVAREFMELHRVYWPEFSGECELRPLQTGMPGTE